MADYAHEYTDEQLKQLERRITDIYRNVFKELSEKVNNYFGSFKKRDEEQQALLNKGLITEQEYTQWRLAQIGRGKRFEAMRDEAAERLTHANEIAVDYINDRTPDIFAVNRNHMAYGLEKQYGNIGFSLMDEHTVKKLIAEQPDFLPTPKLNIPKDLQWNRELIADELTSGILQGESIGKLADRFQSVTDANRVSAIRNARTYFTAAENAGRQDSFNAAAKMGIKVTKRWIATKDDRTRHSHQKLDGQTVPYNEPFISVLGSEMMYPGDRSNAVGEDIYNCRCSMRTVEGAGIEAEPRMMRVYNPVTGKTELVEEMIYDEWVEWKKALAILQKG